MVTILDFLKSNFSKDVYDVKPITGGERSKAFIFESTDKKYIFRENRHEIGFKKDNYAADNFGKNVPIPKILKIGPFENHYYAISEYCEGNSLNGSGDKFSKELVNNLLLTLDQIHSISIGNGGYGIADSEGKATYSSWEEWVLKDTTVVTKDDGNYFTWEEVTKIPFVKEEIINILFKEIEKLLLYIPKKRYLIHGDFATGNVMVKDNSVTGVIDWNEFGYGDFLYDVAWLDFWINGNDFAGAYKSHIEEMGMDMSDFEKRIRCHQLFIGLTALGIYAALNLKEVYLSTLDKVKCIITL
ncbi:MAG: aminoglycoside phosphotransferase family protein [Candidatus Shapirobacteria bacterium]|nr:aminoglycoside phosphotransferase family protein [Candidatus Shapirobacteria bacterium]